jgi:hypothetical protein
MQFHVPKPLHGWRQLLGEVGIIVVGVLIALAAQQLVETVQEHRDAADAERRIRLELAASSAVEIERLAIGPCLKQRIGQIAQGLAEGRTDWRGMLFPVTPERRTALREIYHMPSRSWVTDAYREALARGDLNSLDAARRARFASLYSQIDQLAVLNQTEQELTTTLAPLQFNGIVSGPERNQMIATLARLDSINGLIMLIARQNFATTHGLGLAMPSSQLWGDLTVDGRWLSELTMLRKRYGGCVDAHAIDQYDAIAIRGAEAP